MYASDTLTLSSDCLEWTDWFTWLGFKERGMALDEVAEEAGVSRSSVRRKLTKCRAMLEAEPGLLSEVRLEAVSLFYLMEPYFDFLPESSPNRPETEPKTK